jgi:hypothetical protein
MFLGGHSTGSPAIAVLFIGFALVMAVLRSRARGGGGGPFGRGPRGGGGPPGGGQWGSRPPDDTPVQWDIRKPDTQGEDASSDASRDASSERSGDGQNPPSDL